MTDNLRVMICDDHDLVRDALYRVLAAEPGFDALAGSDKASALDAATGAKADVILLDIGMPDMNQIDGLSEVVHACKDCRVVALTGNPTPDLIRRSIDAGAAGFVPKSMPLKALPAAIRLVAAGQVFVPVIANSADAPGEKVGLTERETAALRFLVRGATNKEIARELGLSEVSVKMIIRSVCMKMKTKNRTQAALLAQRDGLV